MENGRSYFFRDLIVKILLVLLFVFLLMWLFPMPDMNPLYDKIYTQNMSSMTDAAKGYFTVSRLPQKEGEVKKLTLKDIFIMTAEKSGKYHIIKKEKAKGF